MRRALVRSAFVPVLLLLAPCVVRAQTISNVQIVKNAGNGADSVQTGNDAFQMKTTVAIQSSTATSFTTRYAEITAADDENIGSRSVTLNSDYTISFAVTAPGGYSLTVQTLLSGAFTLVDDGNAATADMSGIAGAQSGGTLASGTLNIPDPGNLTGSTGGNVGFNPSATAQITGVSNGSPVSHTLSFTWSASCASTGVLITPGDECAVRLGLATEYPSDSAGDYPGVGARTQTDDGHFVTVSVASLCGNGILDAGEQCDDGNTTNGDCCSSTCQFESASTVCRASAGPCDGAEHCTGSSPSCPADVLLPSSTECRSSAGACDPAEHCTGSSASCPADAKSSAVCRMAAGACDVAESCDGVGDDCPPDAIEPPDHVCRPAAGPCDAPDYCTGSSTVCPADLKSTAVCRPVAGVCDVAETCDGVHDGCPTDGFQPPALQCRAAAGACDIAEYCTGTSASCPANAKSTAVCRPAVGACDTTESCDGVDDDCPPDALAPPSQVCRAPVGPCDAAEHCTGVGIECPGDALLPASAVCRPAAGACDVDDHCSGTSAGCPADERAAAGEVCRPAVDGCDAMETCDGTSADCPPDARAPDVDGDGVCDVRDVCQAVSNGSQSDVDGDGLGDECDPCTNVLPVTLLKPRLQMTRLATPPGDDRMRFTAAMQFPVPVSPTIDPMVKGIRLLLMSSHDVPMVDTLLPGGGYNPAADAGWRAQHGGRTWVYRNGGLGTATINGIRRAVVKLALRPGKARVRVTLVGRNGRYPVHVTDMPVKAIVVIDAPLARQGQCGEALLPLPGCRYDEQRGKMRCRG